MAVVNRKALATPALPKETVPVEAFGGDVVVCGLLLTQRLALQARIRHLNVGAEVDPSVDPTIAIVPEMLAQTVVDDEGKPVFDAAQWQTFGAVHQAQALQLFNTAMRLSGFDSEAAEKN